MLVDLRRLAVRPLERDAGVEHVLGERGRFGDRHAAEEHGHRPGRHLVVGHVAADVAGDERRDFVVGKLAAVALFRDQVDDVHASDADASDRRLNLHCAKFRCHDAGDYRAQLVAGGFGRGDDFVAAGGVRHVGRADVVIVERPSTRKPAWAATITSGTVDMPTASPPR